MVDSITLLANHTKDGRRTPVLRYEFDDRQLRATPLYTSDEEFLRLEAWLGERYIYVVIDAYGQLVSKQLGLTRELLRDYLDEDLLRQGLHNVRRGDSLTAEHVQNGRRTSVLSSDDGRWSVRSKIITGDEWSLLHVRVEVAELGFVHLAIQSEEGRVAAITTGATDSDAWHRLQGELERRDYELD